jgi:hypothetical protein
VIESRIQEAGGSPREESAVDLAARARHHIQANQKRVALLNSAQGVEIAWKELQVLFDELISIAGRTDGFIRSESRTSDCVVIVGGSRRVTVIFELAYQGSLTGSELRVMEWNGRRQAGGRSSPNQRSIVYDFDIDPASDAPGWRKRNKGGNELLTTGRFADELMKTLVKDVSSDHG